MGDRSPRRYWHVSSSKNRASIAAHGLDWRRMGQAPGVAGSHQPEVAGVFLCASDWEADWFAGFGQVGPVDIWAVDGVAEAEVVTFRTGYLFVARTIPPESLELVATDVVALTHRAGPSRSTFGAPPRHPASDW